MPNTTTSPLMLLVLPIPGVEVGPAWASELITAIGSLVDAHDHSVNKGTPVTPAGLNINADLTINSHNLLAVLGLSLAASGVPANGRIYRGTGGTVNELFYQDGAGNVVQITSNGALNVAAGNITGMAGGAAVSYNNATKTFVFIQSANKPAAISAGDLLVTDDSVMNGNAVTLQAPDGLAGSYALTLPGALPAAQRIVTLDNNGNLAASLVRLVTVNQGSTAGFTAETVVAGGKSGASPLPADDTKLTGNVLRVGSTIRAIGWGICTSTATNTVQFHLRVGGAGTVADAIAVSFAGFNSGNGGAPTYFAYSLMAICTAIGANASFDTGMLVIWNAGTDGILTSTMKVETGAFANHFDSTVTEFFEVAASSAANTTLQFQGAIFEIFV